MPITASKSASLVVAMASSTSVPSLSVNFSTPTTSATSTMPLLTAMYPWRSAAPPEAPAASTVTASMPVRPA